MRTILLIPALLISSLLFGQIPTSTGENPIAEYALAHEGDKVGTGLCFDLVRKACEKENRKWYKKVWCDDKELRKHLVKSPEPGDVIQFRYVKLEKNGKDHTISRHVGIVVEVINDSTLVYAEQNVIMKGDPTKIIKYEGQTVRISKNSVVILSEINPLSLTKGKINYYRF